MLAYLLAPSFQCVNVNGKPLTGGYIQSFLTGTVTQAITYSDFSGTQNASQVTLDSKGMATIIAGSSTALDVYCYNASGVLQWSRMNVTPGSGGGSSQTLIFDPMPTENSFNPVYSNGIYAAIKNEASARALADASLQNSVLQNTSDIAGNTAAIANKLSASDITVVSPILKTEPVTNKVQISHAASGVNAGTYGEMSNVAPNFGGSFKTLQASVNSTGHVTGLVERTVTLPDKSVSNFIGGFNAGTLARSTLTKSTMSKTSGTLSFESDAVTLPAGTYHVTIKASAMTNTAEANNVQAEIKLSAKISETLFDLFVFAPNVNNGSVQFFTHSFDITLSSEGTLSVWGDYETEEQEQGWTLAGNIYIHSAANVNGGSSGGIAEVSHDDTLTGKGTIASPIGLAGPLHYVKGDTDYGGTIAPNLDALTRSGYYTCVGAATGAPNSTYNWFVIHSNSNAGTLYAQQTAIAYNSAAIICYERVKANGTWGSWILRTSGSSVAALKYDNTMDALAAKDNVSLHAGTDTQWSAHAALWKPKANMIPVVGTSTINFILPQPVYGKNYILAAYKYETSGTHTLLCSTGISSMPSGASIQSVPVTRKIADFAGGQATYLVIFTNANGARCSGVLGENLNLTPYLSAYKANMGVLTEAPSTLTFDGEESNRLYASITI